MVKIFGDTLSCIPSEDAWKMGIAYLPQIIIFGDRQYRDDTEINHKTFLEMLKASSTLPKTAAPAPELYHPLFEKALSEGQDIVVICPSTDLSGTVRSAEVAARDFPDANIHVVDTRSIAGALGSIVRKSLEWANQGMDAETIVKNVREMSSRARTYFVVDTLEYLHKGGRIGGAQALLGSILQVKPILMLKDGRVEAKESQRTHKRALARLEEIVIEECPRGAESHLTVMHGGAEDMARQLAEDYGKAFGVADIPIFDLPPAVLVHSGPGAVAISFFAKEKAQ